MSRSKPWNHHHYARVHVGRGVRNFHDVRAVQPEHGTRAFVWTGCITETPRFCGSGRGKPPTGPPGPLKAVVAGRTRVRGVQAMRLTDPRPCHLDKMSCKKTAYHQHCARAHLTGFTCVDRCVTNLLGGQTQRRTFRDDHLNGQIRLKEKIGNEKQTLPRKSRKKLPRNLGITNNLLRRNRSSQTNENL